MSHSPSNVTHLGSYVLERAARRSAGAISPARLRQILQGATPVWEERFCFWDVLAQSSPAERVHLAIHIGKSWPQFAARFEALTGIGRERARYAQTLYPSQGDQAVTDGRHAPRI